MESRAQAGDPDGGNPRDSRFPCFFRFSVFTMDFFIDLPVHVLYVSLWISMCICLCISYLLPSGFPYGFTYAFPTFFLMDVLYVCLCISYVYPYGFPLWIRLSISYASPYVSLWSGLRFPNGFSH